MFVVSELRDRRAHLPVTIFAGAFECGVDIGSLEVRQRDDRASTNGGFVIERREDGRSSAVVTYRTECGDR